MWEEIPRSTNIHSCMSDRLEVPGGWIVRSVYYVASLGVSIHQVFVTDPKHTWRLDNAKTST